MSGRLAEALRTALESPIGDHLGQVFHAPFVTVLLAEQGGGEATAEALEVARDALARCGVAPGRQMVLLASTGAPLTDAREVARALRSRLGLPVVLHDPARSPSMLSSKEGGLRIALDDELREAEAVVVVSEIRVGAAFGEAGGEELLVPGAADAESIERCARLATTPEGRAEVARVAMATCRIDYALLWSRGEDVRAWAGEAPAVFDLARQAITLRRAPRAEPI